MLAAGAMRTASVYDSRPAPASGPRGHRFPPEIIGHAVWVYHRFCLSFRDVEDHLADAESSFLTKPSGDGAANSDPTMPDVSRRNRDASVIPGIWTNSSSQSTASSSIFGVPWIRRVMSSPNLEISLLRGLVKRNGGLTISNFPSPISPNSFRLA